MDWISPESLSLTSLGLLGAVALIVLCLFAFSLSLRTVRLLGNIGGILIIALAALTACLYFWPDLIP